MMRRISAKKLARLGGQAPWSSITGKRKAVRRERPELFRNHKRDTNFLDARSYVTKGGRVRLFGKDYERLRWAAYMRSLKGLLLPYCECGCGHFAWWIDGDPLNRGELSHNEHGARKSDELSRVKWMRHKCHMESHNAGGKPCPKKPKGDYGNTN